MCQADVHRQTGCRHLYSPATQAIDIMIIIMQSFLCAAYYKRRGPLHSH
jgi:hypothetical protein